jgi:DNA (cytosine-5)-methyltransferase 1
LENVEGLVKHDLENKNDKIGGRNTTTIFKYENDLGYKVSWKVLIRWNLVCHNLKTVVGTKSKKIDLTGNEPKYNAQKSIF